MTTTKTETSEEMLRHHRQLEAHVESRVDGLTRAVTTGGPFEPMVADLVACLADEVLPHALAEEHTIYRVAATRAGLSDTVAQMITQHRMLASAAERLADTPSAEQAVSLAQDIATLFATHVAKENDILLPPLVADDDVDLVQLLVQMHRLTEAAMDETATSDDVVAPDPEAVMLSLLLQATQALAHAGLGERACRLAASAWAALRVPRPELAVRVTASLHGLVRLASAEPVSFRSASEARPQVSDCELDVRDLAPAQRHESIFAAYEALGAGAAFVLVNDHDPKPLRYQFEAEHSHEFTWDTVEAGPVVWRVCIGKPSASQRTPGETPEMNSDDERELDVRPLAHARRHDVIFGAYEALGPGGGFVLVNDHDPKPLRYQFEAQHRGDFTWEYLETGPREWRVRIGRAAPEGLR
ncbi:MAG: DUF2249 domain-containing protein [Acidimicrobiales bacterium]